MDIPFCPEEALTVEYANRDQLYRSAVEVLGREEADTLMASLPPVDWSDVVTKPYLDQRLDAMKHELTATFEAALRKQTQWVFGAVVLQTTALLIAVLTLA